jgi:hypothetical protein
MQDKVPRNANGELHGPFQDYHSDGRPWETSHYINDVAYGYCEINSWFDDIPKIKMYFCR